MLHSFLESGSIISSGDKKLFLGRGNRTWLSKPSKEPNISFYFPDFFLSNKNCWFIHSENSEIDIDQLSQMLDVSLVKPNIDWKNNQKHLFSQIFHDLKQRIASKVLSKGVPFVFEKTSQRMTTSILSWILNNLIDYAKNNPVHLYGFWDQERGMLGATPEKLFSLHHQKKIETMACAGTARNQEQLDRLLSDPKELQEHQLVVRGILESLSPFGNTTQNELQVLNLPNLSHLVTSIQATLLRPVDFESVVYALHPTPALGAYPKIPGMLWLQNFQTIIDRQRFGAPVGYRHPHQDVSHCYVAIRNIQWDKSGIYIGAGCGVVQDSVLENEWQEIEAKIKAIKTMMGI